MLVADLLDEVFPDHQAVYAIHTNTDNLHGHFIVNTVGLKGKKIHMDKSFMSKVFDPALNRLAEKYGFTPNEAWVKEKQMDKKHQEHKKKAREDLDEFLLGVADQMSGDFDDYSADSLDWSWEGILNHPEDE
jgi:hypothetical protein